MALNIKTIRLYNNDVEMGQPYYGQLKHTVTSGPEQGKSIRTGNFFRRA